MAINETCTGYINLNADNERMSRYTVYILVEKQREKEIEIERERAIDGTSREMKLYGQLSAVFREN